MLPTKTMGDDMKLNDTTVKGLERPEGKSDWIYFDDDPKARGFGVRLRAGCKPLFVFQYRTAGGRQRRMTIAKVEKLGIDTARKRARELAAEVVLGRDPQAAKAEQNVEKAKKEAAAKHTVG